VSPRPDNPTPWDIAEKPVLTKNETSYSDSRETHPAYATIGAHRVSSTPGAVLFQSDFTHQHYMTISIHRAVLDRGLSNDHVFARNELIEVGLSEAQWATFVSTVNMGMGVPCTLMRYAGDEGFFVPRIIPDQTRVEQSKAEVDATVTKGLAALDDLRAAVNTSGLSQKAKRDLDHKIRVAEAALGGGAQWVAKQFDEHMEKTVERAKIEVEAYLTSAVQRAGLQALGAGDPPFQLRAGDDSENV
jgi:hypothetical protein